ncbi:hypothetical protein pipiens_000841, partial [Culex pipiens pipiens]
RHPLDTDLAVAAEFVLQSVHHRVLQHATGRPGVLPADAQWSAAAEDTERGRRSWWGQDFLRPAHAQPQRQQQLQQQPAQCQQPGREPHDDAGVLFVRGAHFPPISIELFGSHRRRRFHHITSSPRPANFLAGRRLRIERVGLVPALELLGSCCAHRKFPHRVQFALSGTGPAAPAPTSPAPSAAGRRGRSQWGWPKWVQSAPPGLYGGSGAAAGVCRQDPPAQEEGQGRRQVQESGGEYCQLG